MKEIRSIRKFWFGFRNGHACELFLKHAFINNQYIYLTRLHSSRIRTARALTTSPSMLGGFHGGSRGVPGPGDVCSGAAVVSQHALRQTPPYEQNHTHLWKHNLAPTSLRAVKIYCPITFYIEEIWVMLEFFQYTKWMVLIFTAFVTGCRQTYCLKAQYIGHLIKPLKVSLCHINEERQTDRQI